MRNLSDMIEDFRLKTFVTVANLGSFTAAAKELGVSQPAVSQIIAELEQYTGQRLMDRTSRSLSLTIKGEQFLAQSQAILESYSKLESEMKGTETILISNVLHNGKPSNILIRRNKFADIDAPANATADKIIDGSNMAILPSFFNTHTHAATTLFRGNNFDPQQRRQYEDALTADDIRQGSDIAIVEMASGGTSFFSDMYFGIEETIKMVDQRGLRAAIGLTMLSSHNKAQIEQKIDFIKNWQDPTEGRVQLVIAPDSIYTTDSDRLKKSASLARRYGLRIHLHLCETAQEVEDCYRKHGKSPVRYLDSLGVLGDDVIAAHCVHIEEKDWKLLARRGVTVAHCPSSNMSMGSGSFPYELAIDSGCRITIGTDDLSLNMMAEMRTAALLSKMSGAASFLPLEEIFKWATLNGAEAFGVDAGAIANGKIADAMLLDLSNARLQSCSNIISNLVYCADSSIVKMLVCNGVIVYDDL